jgi:hypothetical protein
MSEDKELEEMLGIMEKEKKPNEWQIKVFAQMLANYEGQRFDKHYQRFRKLEYK